ncbi:alpha/beta-Hydrolases superfamily protein [Striga asiatica]|uniref:Alpha/beta-Hydrolases superfamily protein n=1 Tax=Striga asiatica TaxID=4170 RepID=A0A5A7Q596_STRAF|nr:alpha/beta-Hydrolases superfamily protein [Striga asiatica]
MEMGNSRAEKERHEKENVMGLEEHKLKAKKKKTTKRFYYLISKFGCFRSDDAVQVAEKPAPENDGSFEAEAVGNGREQSPYHLIVMVNGIIGSAQNWRYAATQFVKAYPNDVKVHCSESNSSMLTFDGVDVMGKRLADEVISVVGRHPNLQKISFVSHSLGGLVARFAIAELYQQSFIVNSGQDNGEEDKCRNLSSEDNKLRGKIAGLEPVNFITSATPHLGSRGYKQVPVFCGFHTLEKLASRSSWLLGRTGEHLFLSDGDGGKPPLLLRMSSDSEDLKFISALDSFKRRVAYANTRFDHLVGWSSSSLRRQHELPKHRCMLKNPKYPHIVNEELPRMTKSQEVTLEASAASGRGRTSDMEGEFV